MLLTIYETYNAIVILIIHIYEELETKANKNNMRHLVVGERCWRKARAQEDAHTHTHTPYIDIINRKLDCFEEKNNTVISFQKFDSSSIHTARSLAAAATLHSTLCYVI